MNTFVIALALISSHAFGQYAQKAVATSTQNLDRLDLHKICDGKDVYDASLKRLKLNGQDIIVMDNGFCAEFREQQAEIREAQTQQRDETPESKDRWKVRLYASHSFTTYFNSDVTFKSTRYNILIKDYEWAERGSREFFEPKTWKEEGNNPAQVLDEPTNTFTASIEKNGHEFFIQAFHPKFLQARDQVKYMQGTIDGTWVDGFAPLNKPFDGYDQVPGESEIVRNDNTHLQMTFEVGYGHRFDLVKGKYGSITYVPSLAVGVMVGKNVSAVVAEGQWWEFEGYEDTYEIQGIGGSVTNRIEFNTKKERVGLFYENKLSYYRQNHSFLDGSQKYNLMYMGNSVGVKFMIYNPKNHKDRASKAIERLQ